MFQTYPKWKWWFKTVDPVRNCAWYTCQYCMCTGLNSSRKIEHKQTCTRPTQYHSDGHHLG